MTPEERAKKIANEPGDEALTADIAKAIREAEEAMRERCAQADSRIEQLINEAIRMDDLTGRDLEAWVWAWRTAMKKAVAIRGGEG